MPLELRQTAEKEGITAADLEEARNAIAKAAEEGDFTQAVKWQQKAAGLTTDPSAAVYRDQLVLYKAGKPYRQK